MGRLPLWRGADPPASGIHALRLPTRSKSRRASAPPLLLCLLLASACGEPEEAAPRQRVLLVGIDGATLRIAEPMMRAGRLPTLARLAREGASGPLRSMLPLRSPRIWTTIATGKPPEQHGILNFFHTRDGARRLYHSTDRRVHALWNIASAMGLRVGVVNWWTTFPPEKVNGTMVSDHFLAAHMEGIRELFHVAPEAGGPVTYPIDWLERIPKILEQNPLSSIASDPFADLDALPAWVARVPDEAGFKFLSKVYRDDATVTRLALGIESELQPELLMVLLLGIDRVSHILWASVEPDALYPPEFGLTAAKRDAGAEALRRYYEYTDQLIAALASRYGPRDTIMVVSDHGFEADVSSDTVTGGHRGKQAIDGLLFARGPEIAPASSSKGTRVADIAPTLLVQLGLPPAADMTGRVASFLTAQAREPVASYDTGQIEYVEGSDSRGEAQMIERLRALGYGD